MKPTLKTRVAHAGWSEHRYHGYRVFEDLAGHATYIELVILGVTGRRVERQFVPILNDMAAVMSVADPRIWPLKTGRIVGSYGSFPVGLAAGSAALEGAFVGPAVGIACARQLVELAEYEDEHGTEALDQEIERRVNERVLMAGFGVPFRKVDERVVALNACVEERGMQNGRYWQLLTRIVRIFREHGWHEPNIAGSTTAVFLDVGLKPKDVGPTAQMLLIAPIMSNVLESARRRDAVLRKLPEDCLDYQGRAARRSPRFFAHSPSSGAGRMLTISPGSS